MMMKCAGRLKNAFANLSHHNLIFDQHRQTYSSRTSVRWPSQKSCSLKQLLLLTGCLGQVGKERLEAGGKPLHTLMDICQSLQVTDVTQDLILGDQLVPEVPREHL